MTASPASSAAPSSSAAAAARLPPVRPVRVTLRADALGYHHDPSCIGCGAPRPDTQLKLVGPWTLSGPATVLVVLVGIPLALVVFLLVWLFLSAALHELTRLPIELCILVCLAVSAGLVGLALALLFRKVGRPPLRLTVGRCRSCRREAMAVSAMLLGTALFALFLPMVLGRLLLEAGARPAAVAIGCAVATLVSLVLVVWRRELVFRQGLHTARLYGDGARAVVLGSLARSFPWAVEKVEHLHWRWRPMDTATQRALSRPLQ